MDFRVPLKKKNLLIHWIEYWSNGITITFQKSKDLIDFLIMMNNFIYYATIKRKLTRIKISLQYKIKNKFSLEFNINSK
jgi:hypothetical protein